MEETTNREETDPQAMSRNEFLRSKTSWDLAVIAFFENYGWYLLLLVIVIAYALRRAQPTIKKYLKVKADEEYAAKYHKNPDVFAARAAAQEALTQRLQQKYAKDAVEYQQKMEEKETKKREEWLARHSSPSSGHKLGNGSNKEKSTLKPEYLPLTGGASGNSYRPPRRSPCSGGGCGR